MAALPSWVIRLIRRPITSRLTVSLFGGQTVRPGQWFHFILPSTSRGSSLRWKMAGGGDGYRARPGRCRQFAPYLSGRPPRQAERRPCSHDQRRRAGAPVDHPRYGHENHMTLSLWRATSPTGSDQRRDDTGRSESRARAYRINRGAGADRQPIAVSSREGARGRFATLPPGLGHPMRQIDT